MGHKCCSKQKVRRGLWSPEEDDKLVTHITSHGHGSWSSVPKLAGLQRCGKSCRLRWINYLRPDLRRGSFTEDEERTIIEVHRILGNRWAQVAKHLPGRTDNEVKNFWNSCIKKKLLAQGLDPNTHNLLPSLHKKSKNDINVSTSSTRNNRTPSSVPSSFTFSVDQTMARDTISKVTLSRCVQPVNETRLESQNIGFSCNSLKETTQPLDVIPEFPSTQCFDLSSMGKSKNVSSFDTMYPCDIILDENTSWNATLGSLEQPFSTAEVLEQQYHTERPDNKIGATGQGISCDPSFGASFNNSGFDYCFEQGYCSTILSNSSYGDIVSIMEQNAWGNC